MVHRKFVTNFFGSIPSYNQWDTAEALESTESAPAIKKMLDNF